jgi:hypothetical protein
MTVQTRLFGLGFLFSVTAAAAGAGSGCVPESFTFTSAASSGSGGAGGANVCEPGATEACYAGPEGTIDIGPCKGGTRTCSEDGSGFGACEGEVLPAFDDCATMADEDCSGAAPTCTGSYLWSIIAGDAMAQRGWAVAVDAEKNVAVAGDIRGSATFGMSTVTSVDETDIVVAKIDPTGKPLWVRRWGDVGAQQANGVAFDAAGNVFVVGSMTGSVNFGTGLIASKGLNDMFVVKLDPSGTAMWAKTFGDIGDDKLLDIAVDPMGRLLVTGIFGDVVDFGFGKTVSAGGIDGIVLMLDPGDGHALWTKPFGNAGTNYGWRVKSDAEGNALVAGFGDAGGINFGAGLVTGPGMNDAYLLKIDPNGGLVWAKVLGGPEGDAAYDVGVGPDGEVVVAGTFSGTGDFGSGSMAAIGQTDMFMSRFDKDGDISWSKRYGAVETQPNGVAIDGAGHIVVTGFVRGDVDFGNGLILGHADADAFIAKIDKTGAALWGKNFGTEGGTERGNDVALAAAGEPVVAGYFDSVLVFPEVKAMFTSAGAHDIFVVRFVP